MKHAAPFLLVCALAACAAPARNPLGDRLGVVHVHGRYCFTDKDFLNEGADEVLALGSRVVKFWLHNIPEYYRFNHDWPEAKDMVEYANTSYFREAFSKPFTTIILVAYSPKRDAHYWKQGVTPEQAQAEEKEFYELTRHLLETYRGTGKTFVLQHWEGDWAARGHFDPQKDPTPLAFEGMIQWLNARQKGVDRARAEVGQKGVRVLHAAEVNRPVQEMKEGRVGVTTKVLPHTNVDMVSYSAWDGQNERDLLRETLDFIAKHMPDRPPFGDKNVYVGEFGSPENLWPPDLLKKVVPGVVETGLEWGCPWIVFWELYCNEPKMELRPLPRVDRNDQSRGFWMIRPDGTKAWPWHYYRERLQ